MSASLPVTPWHHFAAQAGNSKEMNALSPFVKVSMLARTMNCAWLQDSASAHMGILAQTVGHVVLTSTGDLTAKKCVNAIQMENVILSQEHAPVRPNTGDQTAKISVTVDHMGTATSTMEPVNVSQAGGHPAVRICAHVAWLLPDVIPLLGIATASQAIGARGVPFDVTVTIHLVSRKQESVNAKKAGGEGTATSHATVNMGNAMPI